MAGRVDSLSVVSESLNFADIYRLTSMCWYLMKFWRHSKTKYRYILQSLRKWNHEPRNLNADNVELIRDSSTPRSNRSFDIFEREIKRKAGLRRKAEVNRKFMQETSIHHW